MNCLVFLLSFTMHVGVHGDYNNIHPHLQCTKDTYIMGTYYNSEKNISYYFGKNYKLKNWEIDTALVTGYHDKRIQPMLRIKRNNWYLSPMYEKYYPNSHREEVNYGLVIGYETKIR